MGKANDITVSKHPLKVKNALFILLLSGSADYTVDIWVSFTPLEFGQG